MNDKGKIVFGLIVFLVIVTFPLWYGLVTAGTVSPPDVELPASEKNCVENKEYMVAHHMDLLDQWRDAVVRKGRINYTSRTYGKTYEMSLTKTCMKCHNNREKFCDRCHTYADVDPYCWDCHLEPEEVK
ncbi:MAG: sulfate reduction electron transfer complex DsrMKJOP subunit DsrJ [bacterium]